MSADVAIERARAEDTGEILRFVEENELPLDGLSDHLGTALIARHAGRIVGTAALEIYADGALLRSVAVAPLLRGAGLGNRLTQAAIELAGSRHLPAVYLLTTTAEGFFPRHGFEIVDRQDVPMGVRGSVEFVCACPATAVVMMRRLDRST